MDATKLKNFLKNKKEEEEIHSYYCIGKSCMTM